MGSTKGILFDLDGVIYNGDTPIDGAPETARWAREQGIPHLFLTNTTSRPRSALVEKLGRLGIRATVDQIISPPAAAARWLRTRVDSVRAETAVFVPATVRPEFEALSLLPDDAEQGASYVVVGDLAEQWTFRVLNRAFRLLHANRDAALIALGMTRYYMGPDGPNLDVAPFVKALEHATDRTAVVLGKPAPEFFLAAAELLGLEPAELLMIGDDIRTDIGGAQQAGIAGALVRTGKFRESDLDGEISPEVVLKSVAELPEWWSDRS